MNHRHIHQTSGYSGEWLMTLPIILLISLYLFASITSSRRLKPWPHYRSAFWVLGILCVAATVVGPIAQHAHHHFTWHMVGHLLLGMLAPLLIALSAPMTLLLRTVNVSWGRRLTLLLKSPLVRFLSNPIVAAILNFGGLWVLYTTNLYAMMLQSMLLHILVHLHVFLAGYFFTVSIIYIDPIYHRTSFLFRSIVLVLSLASHSILSKYIYANPPAGVPAVQAETGGLLMYYGGDLIDLFLIWLLCFQWYKAAKPRGTASVSGIVDN